MGNKVVVVANQKGGVGKSTLCANLGVAASATERTGLVDTDIQGTLTKWHKRRVKARGDEPNLQRAEFPLDKLGAGLRAMDRQGYGVTFIDTTPSRSDEIGSVIKLADLVVIPTRASLADIEALIPTVRMAKEAGKQTVFVLNFTKPHARQTLQAVARLSHYGPVMECMLADRTIYADCLTEGLAAAEANPKGPAVAEMGKLWSGIQAILHS